MVHLPATGAEPLVPARRCGFARLQSARALAAPQFAACTCAGECPVRPRADVVGDVPLQRQRTRAAAALHFASDARANHIGRAARLLRPRPVPAADGTANRDGLKNIQGSTHVRPFMAQGPTAAGRSTAFGHGHGRWEPAGRTCGRRPPRRSQQRVRNAAVMRRMVGRAVLPSDPPVSLWARSLLCTVPSEQAQHRHQLSAMMSRGAPTGEARPHARVRRTIEEPQPLSGPQLIRRLRGGGPPRFPLPRRTAS
jgi:hypothetical protein